MASTSNLTSSSVQCSITFDFDPKNNTHLPPAVIPTWISLAAINAVTSPPTVFVNLLVIWTVLESEELRSNSYNILVTMLSFSDLLVGLVVQPLYIALKVCILMQCSRVCELAKAYTISGLLCSAWTVVTMVIVSLERYLFIEYPLYHQSSVTLKKLLRATAASWLLVGTAILITWLQVHESVWERQIPVILTFGPSIIIILFCVIKIHLRARRQMRAIAAQQQSVAQRQSVDQQQSVTQQSRIKEYKRALTLGLIVLASVACLCPILILKIVVAVKGNWSDAMKYLKGTTATFLHLQSLINPIIYSLRLSDIRSGVAKRLCGNCK